MLAYLSWTWAFMGTGNVKQLVGLNWKATHEILWSTSIDDYRAGLVNRRSTTIAQKVVFYAMHKNKPSCIPEYLNQWPHYILAPFASLIINDQTNLTSAPAHNYYNFMRFHYTLFKIEAIPVIINKLLDVNDSVCTLYCCVNRADLLHVAQ